MSTYRQQVISALNPDLDGIFIIDGLDELGILPRITLKDLAVLIKGKPNRTDKAGYMRWYRLCQKYGIETGWRGVTRDKVAYNRDYYRQNRGAERGAQAWEMVLKRVQEITSQLEQLARFAERRAGELRSSPEPDPEPPDSGSGHTPPSYPCDP